MSRSIDARLQALERIVGDESSSTLHIWWVGDDGQRTLGEVAPGNKVDYRRGLGGAQIVVDWQDKTGYPESDAS